MRGLPAAVGGALSLLPATGVLAQQTGRCEASKAEFAVAQRYSPEVLERAARFPLVALTPRLQSLPVTSPNPWPGGGLLVPISHFPTRR
jgi:hypothetical protein